MAGQARTIEFTFHLHAGGREVWQVKRGPRGGLLARRRYISYQGFSQWRTAKHYVRARYLKQYAPAVVASLRAAAGC